MNAPVKARYLLGGIRLVNGALALFVPQRLIRMFGEDPEEHGPAIYALRLFGVRTVVLGVQLLIAKKGSERLDDALRYVVPIHASDTASAALATLGGHLPRKAGLTGVAVSSLNTVLAVVASRAR